VPAEHAAHELAPAPAAKVLAGQLVQVAAPAVEMVPESQLVHAVRVGASANLPAGQTVQPDEPALSV